MIRYIAPNGHGDGSTVALAASIYDLDNQCVQAGPGGEVWILADRGDYFIPMISPGQTDSAGTGSATANGNPFVTLSTQVGTAVASGVPSGSVKIRGKTSDGTSAYASFRSDRVRPYTSQSNMHIRFPGQAGIGVNVDYVDFEFLKFKDFGFGCIIVQGPTMTKPNGRVAINADHMIFDNVRRGWWVRSQTGLSNCTLQRISGIGTSKGFIRFDGFGDNIVIQDFDLDGDRQNGDSFGMGIHLNGDVAAHAHTNWIIRRGTLRNFWQILESLPAWSSTATYASGDYVLYNGSQWRSTVNSNLNHAPGVGVSQWTWSSGTDLDTNQYFNADGFIAERNDAIGLVEDVYAADCTDGGFDFKATNVILNRCVAEGNKRNYRIFGVTVTLIDCEGYEPVHRGGSGGARQVWMNDGGPRMINCLFDNRASTTSPFENDYLASKLGYIDRGTRIITPPGVDLYTGTPQYFVVDPSVRIEVTPAPTLQVADFVAATPVVMCALRRLKANYGGPLIKVRRASDNATQDIYPIANGDLDTSALAAFCGASVGTIQVWYDQSGGGRNFVTAVTTREYQIYNGTSVIQRGTNNRPSAYVDAADRGYTAAIPSVTAAPVSAVMVASMGNGTVATAPGPRFMSLIDTTGTNADNNSANRGILIGRQGASSPSSTWQIYRNSAVLAAIADAYDTLESVSAIFDGTNASLRVNDGTAATGASSAAWVGTRLGVGYTGTVFASAPNSYVSELWFFASAINALDRDELHSNQKSYYGIA